MRYRSIPIGIVALVVLSGCSDKAADGANNTATDTTTTASTTTASAPPLTIAEPSEPKEAMLVAPAKKNYTIGVSLLTQDDEFYKALKKGLEDEAAADKVTIKIESADKDLSKQVNQVQDFLTQGVDAIIVCPVDSQGIGSAIAQANAHKTPVFTADIASKSGTVVSHIASDNVQGGSLDGDYVGKTLLKGKGNVAILDLSTVTSVQDRVKGFKDAIAKYPGIKIVADVDVPDAKRENAEKKAMDLLTSHPDIDVIFGINDPVALGTLSSLKEANNTKTMVVGFDAVPEAQNYISTGTSQLKADAIQYPDLIGKTTVDTVVNALNGNKVPPLIAVPTGLVTADSFKK
ncbi:MAG TPA: substrate-binding domain-containing protein [Fimbriimonadaceae bacterium]|jgi:ribose transport system substrate-binding protein